MKEKFITLLTVASGLKGFGLKFIRVAILVVFVWIAHTVLEVFSLRSRRHCSVRCQQSVYEFLLCQRRTRV